jgi:hypothetical protein
MRLRIFSAFFLVLSLLIKVSEIHAGAADIHVNPTRGDDASDGSSKPVKTIKRAISLAKPGDTVHLTTALYHESADLHGKKGEPGKPITLDGHGAVLDGSEPVRAANWEALGNGLFRKVHLMPHMENASAQGAVMMRWFFLWNGKMNHMGRTSKGPSAPLKKPADLQPGEWTYAKEEDAFYLRLPPGQDLDAANIRAPIRDAGVAESGGTQHVIVRNLITSHVYNDGYNIHGSERDCVFENIAAIECGDDGFSAHEDAECRIDGYVSIGNSTGLCDTVSSITHYRNLFIKDCLGYDVFFIGDSPHSIENGLVISGAHNAVSLGRHTDRTQKGPSAVTFTNVRVQRVGGPQEVRVTRDAKLTARQCTFTGLNVQLSVGGEMNAENCVFNGEPKPEIILGQNTLWLCDGNSYEVASLKMDKVTFTEKNFKDFQHLSGGDKTSRWGMTGPEVKNAGADEAAMKKLEAAADDVVKRWRALEASQP